MTWQERLSDHDRAPTLRVGAVPEAWRSSRKEFSVPATIVSVDGSDLAWLCLHVARCGDGYEVRRVTGAPVPAEAVSVITLALRRWCTWLLEQRRRLTELQRDAEIAHLRVHHASEQERQASAEKIRLCAALMKAQRAVLDLTDEVTCG